MEIVRVGEGSPAAAESLQAGDLVIQVQGTAVASVGQYRQAVLSALGYGEVGLVVMRAGWARHVRLRPAAAGAFGSLPRSARPVPKSSRSRPGALGAAAGLQPGDLITMADGRLLDGKSDFQQLATPFASRGAPFEIVVKRADWTKTVTLAARRPPSPLPCPLAALRRLADATPRLTAAGAAHRVEPVARRRSDRRSARG